MTSRLRIAVADDEPEMRDFFQKVLSRIGHQVVLAAESGDELVAQCRRHQPDLIISDVKMPGLDGIAASSQVYQERPLPVILVTAYHDPELIAQAQADHVLAYLVKPIGTADLAPAITLAMRRFGDQQALAQRCAELEQALQARTPGPSP